MKVLEWSPDSKNIIFLQIHIAVLQFQQVGGGGGGGGGVGGVVVPKLPHKETQV